MSGKSYVRIDFHPAKVGGDEAQLLQLRVGFFHIPEHDIKASANSLLLRLRRNGFGIEVHGGDDNYQLLSGVVNATVLAPKHSLNEPEKKSCGAYF